ncbi:MAG TPA: phosphoribosyltransferase family protein, partial [Syntrophales bacterium]|nr:phosphoribosyltransferase family protein [Syntrophales bacterium]
LGADALANALAVISYQHGKPIKAFIVRKDVKDHGTKSALEGDVKAGERVVVLDDVITTGGSTITAIERVRAAGLVVDRVIALIDREEGGRENILSNIPRVESVVTRSEIMQVYEKK